MNKNEIPSFEPESTQDLATYEGSISSTSPTEKMPSPWLYIITLYLPFGLLDGGLKVHLPNNLFKLLEFSNQEIGLLGGIGIVASFRFLFAPWLDGATTKRRLSIITLALAGLLAFAAAGVIYFQPERGLFLWCMVAVLFGMAIVSASHETAADGYYIRALNPKLQAQFIGIKTASIRIGIISANTGLLLLATKYAAGHGATGIESIDKTGFHLGFALAFAIAGVVMLLFATYNKLVIPKIPQDQPVRHGRFALGEVLRDYFRQHKVLLIVLFILLYRFGEGFLVMKYPFYLDSLAKGGLASQASNLAFIALLAEMPWMIVGGIFGGYLIKWYGLRHVFIPLALCISIPTVFFVWLAMVQPQATVSLFGENLNIALLVSSSVEALGYGMSFSAMFYYIHIMATESGRNKTSILAVSLAIMNLGWIVPGMMSGFVQAAFGYTGLFLISTIVGFIVLILIPLLPMPKGERA